jgi:FkbH-like protein
LIRAGLIRAGERGTRVVVDDFVALVRKRLAGQSGQRMTTVIRNNAGFVMQSVLGRFSLRDCDEVGPWVRVIGGMPRVHNQGRIEVGERTRLFCSYAAVDLRTAPGGTLIIGTGCSINFGTLLDATRLVKIGDGVSIGPYSIVSDTDAPEAPGGGNGQAQPIEIGDGAWLATRVTLRPGARIGKGSVITAGSVVTGEIPSRVVAGGTPARVLRRLDDEASDAPSTAELESRSAVHSSLQSAEVPVAAADSAHARGAHTEAAPDHEGVLISDFTIDELGRSLEKDASKPLLRAEIAPFGQVIPSLMTPPRAGVDFAVVWTRPEGVIESFARLLEFEAVDDALLLEEVDRYAELLLEGLKSYRFAAVPTWTLPPWSRGLGLADTRRGGATRALHAMNSRLMEKLASAPNIFVLNAERWLAANRGGYSPKLWYMGKVPFVPSVFDAATADIKAAISGLTGGARKLVVVDLDDTLWGGIVGDIGWENLRIGGHDSVGEAFVDFQRALKNLKRRGILLGLVSKNEESVALEAIRNHPEMVLREADFVGYRINWNDKARNVADLASSLNLGLQSVVFIDDNPFERARVREALPEVLVPEWPEDKLLYPSALLSLSCFDTPQLSAEDAARTALYATEREREHLKAEVGSLDEWLASLQIRVRVELLGAANLARTTQLLNKTNQMNLTTRRLTETELGDWVKVDGRWLFTLSVSDRLGDAGLTGILSLEGQGDTARIVDFVLSCRVMGRKIEESMVHLAVETARRHSLRRVSAELLPTPKNKPCQGFWERSQFVRESERVFTWDTEQPYALPAAIALELPL